MVAPCDLTRAQLDALSVLAERDRTGAGVVRELAEQYAEEPHRSTVYHHLDELVSKGLAEKDDRGGDDRAKRYAITSEGESVIREYATSLAVRVQTGEIHRR